MIIGFSFLFVVQLWLYLLQSYCKLLYDFLLLLNPIFLYNFGLFIYLKRYYILMLPCPRSYQIISHIIIYSSLNNVQIFFTYYITFSLLLC